MRRFLAAIILLLPLLSHGAVGIGSETAVTKLLKTNALISGWRKGLGIENVVTNAVSLTNANALHVRMDGNDTTALRGNFDKPFLTISNALSKSQPGDGIIVWPGNYTNYADIFISNSVSIVGISPTRSTIYTTNAVVNVIGGEIGIKDLTFVMQSGNFLLTSTTLTNVVFRNITLTGNTNGSLLIDWDSTSVGRPSFYGCRFISDCIRPSTGLPRLIGPAIAACTPYYQNCEFRCSGEEPIFWDNIVTTGTNTFVDCYFNSRTNVFGQIQSASAMYRFRNCSFATNLINATFMMDITNGIVELYNSYIPPAMLRTTLNGTIRQFGLNYLVTGVSPTDGYVLTYNSASGMYSNIIAGSSTAPIVAGANQTNINFWGSTTNNGDILDGTDGTHDIGKGGANRFRNLTLSGGVTNGGAMSVGTTFNAGGAITGSGNIQAGNASNLGFTGRGELKSSADGLIELFNNGNNNFTALRFGGVTAAFPSLGRTNGDLIVFGADSLFAGGSTNKLVVQGDMVSQSGHRFMSNGIAVATITGTLLNGDCWIGMLSNRLQAVCMSNSTFTFKVLAP